MSVFRRKTLSGLMAEAAEDHSLRRVLGPTHLILLGIGAIIGAGIFSLTGLAAATNAGPAIVLSFLLSGFACAMAGFCYAEMASMIPICGSAYTYSYATMGELIAWIIGWDLILEYGVSVAAIAVGWGGNLNAFLDATFGYALPDAISAAPERKWTLDELAGIAGVSPFHLSHVFNREVGTSVYRYALRSRLAMALEAVLDSRLDLTSIALDSGFTSHSHFTARFRAFFGLTPDALRRSARAGEAAALRKFVTARPAATA